MIAKTYDYSATEEARSIVLKLLQLESRGNGDTEASMRRLGNRYGIPWRVFWTLKYRQPKDVFVGVLRKLREAQAAETKRQLERMAHEIYIAKSNGVRVDDIEDQVEALRTELETCLQKRGEV